MKIKALQEKAVPLKLKFDKICQALELSEKAHNEVDFTKFGGALVKLSQGKSTKQFKDELSRII